jgi:hypothetical protein
MKKQAEKQDTPHNKNKKKIYRKTFKKHTKENKESKKKKANVVLRRFISYGHSHLLYYPTISSKKIPHEKTKFLSKNFLIILDIGIKLQIHQNCLNL